MKRLADAKSVFLDAGGVILDEQEHEIARAAIIVDVLAHIDFSFSLELYWRDVDEAVFRFVPSVYDYILWKHTGEGSLYNSVRAEFARRWKLRTPSLKLMPDLDRLLPELSQKFRIGILGQYGEELRKLLCEKLLLEYFSLQETQEKYQLTKPDPR